MPRANRNARAFGAPLSNSPGWAAGWFFVPIAFWWKPYYAMKEIWQGSDPDPAVNPLQARVSALLPWWWTYCSRLRTVAGMVASKDGMCKTPSDVIDASWIQVVGPVAVDRGRDSGRASSVRALARRQDERQKRRGSRARRAPVTAGAAP